MGRLNYNGINIDEDRQLMLNELVAELPEQMELTLTESGGAVFIKADYSVALPLDGLREWFDPMRFKRAFAASMRNGAAALESM